MKQLQSFICGLLMSIVGILGIKAQQPFDVIISLGGDCQVAYQLSVNGLSKHTLPFDSMLISYESLVDMLGCKFSGFMNPENIGFMVNANGEKSLCDERYGTRLFHDFNPQDDFLKNYTIISSKYLRSIDLFINLVVTAHYPLFIRKTISKKQAIELKNLLAEMRDGRPFLLVCLDDTQEIQSDWQLADVRNYYLQQPEPYTWKGDEQAWKEIFKNIIPYLKY